VVAVEDERFYFHHGLDTVGTARAALDDLSGWCACEGGSTVTQQLAKLAYYPGDDRLARKLPGMAVAFKLETHYDKAEIMAAYLSVVPTGYGLTGARAAACAFFGHDLSALTIAEAAELAGSVQAPSAYDPRYHRDLATDRRDYALERMAQVGSITEQQALAGMLAPATSGAGHC
jgi:membrane peptidoglycan carboxypeptidase